MITEVKDEKVKTGSIDEKVSLCNQQDVVEEVSTGNSMERMGEMLEQPLDPMPISVSFGSPVGMATVQGKEIVLWPDMQASQSSQSLVERMDEDMGKLYSYNTSMLVGFDNASLKTVEGTFQLGLQRGCQVPVGEEGLEIPSDSDIAKMREEEDDVEVDSLGEVKPRESARGEVSQAQDSSASYKNQQ